MRSITINKPDDWHLHLRDGKLLQHTVPASARDFKRALVMPNVKPALVSLEAIESYRKNIIKHIPQGNTFTPYMTFYLNESMNPQDLVKAASLPYVLGGKLYPAGATTNSEAGVRSLKNLYPILEVMQQQSLVLQIHGEVTHGDVFEREAEFIETQLKPIVANFPNLRIVLEHISTKAAVEYISQAPSTLAATITPHHLLYNRNMLLANGIRPHYYCLPILKHQDDQKALQQAASSGNPKFFAGTDSAPHALSTKESACGCAGIYSAPFALAFYTQIFDTLNRLPFLNDFTSRFGAEFYQLPVNQERIELVKLPQTIPELLPLGDAFVKPMGALESIPWSVHV